MAAPATSKVGEAETTREATETQGPVGKSVPRSDGREKVRGEPLYCGDLRMPGMLQGRVLRSRYPHARILCIDTARAKALAGVAAVVVADDIPGVKTLGKMSDQPVLCGDKVRFMGDAVALVAAETEAIAARALELIEVEYEELPTVFSPKEAMLPTAPRLHERRPDNVVHHFKLRKGDVESAFRECDVVVENTYETTYIEHGYIEVEGAVADYSAGGTVTTWAPTQFAFAVRRDIAEVLNLDMAAVRVINTVAGGAFGGKTDASIECCCRVALLSYMAKRPVRLVYSRPEAMMSGGKRHPALMEYKTGATKDGRLLALEARVYLNKGAYASVGKFMPPAGGLTAKVGYDTPGPYVIPNLRLDVYNVHTNMPIAVAVRGFGAPQVNFAAEQQMDEVARQLGIDGVEFRLQNGLEAGSRNVSDEELPDSVGLKETIRRAADAAGWKQYRAGKRREKPGRVLRGMGLSSFFFATASGGWPEYGNCTMEIQANGRIVVRAGIAEVGQGSNTALAQIAAEALGVPLERITLARGDTANDQDSGPTVASRGTIIGGNAIIAAAREARQTLLEMAADLMDLDSAKVAQTSAGFASLDGSRRVSDEEVLLYSFRCGRRLIGKGWWCVPKLKVNPETGLGKSAHIYAYGTTIAEVEVDTLTGRVEVKRVVHAQDVGKAINPALVNGQIIGALSNGLGFALSEELVVKQGRVVNTSLATYLMPTVADMPPIVPIIVEDPYPAGPFGAKGAGEPGAVAVAGALANAVYDAIGVRIRELPITAERVWQALEQKARAAAAN